MAARASMREIVGGGVVFGGVQAVGVGEAGAEAPIPGPLRHGSAKAAWLPATCSATTLVASLPEGSIKA